MDSIFRGAGTDCRSRRVARAAQSASASGKSGNCCDADFRQYGNEIELPEHVLDFTSTNVPEPEVVLSYLPKDSSYVERRYQPADSEIPIEGTIVLMGADRTSIHNADYCLRGQGLNPDAKSVVNIPIAGASPYSLPVSRWDVSGEFQNNGQKIKVSGVYVFWFVADGYQTPDHLEMMWRLATHVAATGELKRWAYVSYFAPCEPGQEDATFERMKKLIAASVPEFQLPPETRGAMAIAPH